MTDFMFSAKAIFFIQSWKRYDVAALRHSTAASVAVKNGRRYYMPLDALKRETDEMCDAKEALCNELGINHVYFMRVLNELRREGTDYADAVRIVIQHWRMQHDAA